MPAVVAKRERIVWDVVLRRAADIVRSYESGVTLRQLFYRLVSEQLIPNKQTAYNSLSSRTAAARRAGWFPDLIDRGRSIQRYMTFDDVADARGYISRIYRLDRSIGQEHTIFIGVEKNGLLNLLLNWFGDFGVSVVALGGYCSQTFCDDIREDVERQGRDAIFIYGGDFDPSGEDILRDFLNRTDCWDRTHKIALLPEQIEEYNLPPLPGKASDSRAAGFIARHGELMQVELDALPPDVLRSLYTEQFDAYWDYDQFEEMKRLERIDRRTLLMANLAADADEASDNDEEE